MVSRLSAYLAPFACLAAAMIAACGSTGETRLDAAVDSGAIDSAAPPAGEAGGAAVLSGTVKDQAGVAVGNAKVAVGAASVFSDTQGQYLLSGLAPGPAVLEVSRDWFKPLESMVTIAASGVTDHDITIEEMPLQLDPADKALAESYGKTFDWTKDKTSIVVVPRPTRRDFDNAVYFHNPALYRDASQEGPLTPPSLPEITDGLAKNFTFPVKSGKNQGQEALEIATIVDAIKDTPLGPAEPADFMMWTPMINWLGETSAATAADLRLVGLAVRQQTWSSNAVRPQEIEKVYLTSGALWVKVVFAPFVQLGAGINDDDGDGFKEIYARVAAAHYPPEIISVLANQYGKALFNTHGLSKEVNKSLSEIYSTTSAVVERFIGQSLELPGVGTIHYPFVVLRHTGGEKNVILVSPAP